MAPLVVIRADASKQMGSGHVMRCLALAEVLRDKGRCVEFVSRRFEGNLIGMTRSRGFVVHELQPSVIQTSEGWLGVPSSLDAAETIEVFQGRIVQWLIVDQYGIDDQWESILRPHVERLMVIDDTAERRHICDVLLDQNFAHKPQLRYQDLVPTGCTQLLGPNYALLRAEFAKQRNLSADSDGTVRRLFVFFGGGDPDNMTGLALQALCLAGLENLHVDIVLGSANPNRQTVLQRASLRPHTRVLVQVDNMAELMSEADLAIGAGGGTTWERMCVGLPSVVVTIADNQVPSVTDLKNQELVWYAGDSKSVEVTQLRDAIAQAIEQTQDRMQRRQRGMSLVDGLGAHKVADFMCDSLTLEPIQLRRALAQDRLLYWQWVNDPAVRASAIDRSPIQWEAHCNWFDKAISNPKKWLFIAHCAYGPVGQVRFEQFEDAFYIDYSLANQFRGRGLAVRLLSMAIDHLGRDRGDSVLLMAKVRRQNDVSAKVFLRLHFDQLPSIDDDLMLFARTIEKDTLV